MAEKFDIAEHIKVEVLGHRIGQLTTESLKVNGKSYNQADYVITDPNSPPREEIGLVDTFRTNQQITLALSTIAGSSTITYPATSGSSYEVWALSSTTNNLNIALDPKASGFAVRSYTTPTVSAGMATSGLSTNNFLPGSDFYLFAVYEYGESAPVGKAIASRFLFAPYTYSFSGASINASNGYWRAANYTPDLVNIRKSHLSNIVPKDVTNPGTARDYKVYFNGVASETFSLSSNTEYWSPSSSALASWVWEFGTNTLELYLASATYGVDSPIHALTVEFGNVPYYKYPSHYEPVKVQKLSSSKALVTWRPWFTHKDQVEFPSTTYDNAYVDIYGSDNTITLKSIPEDPVIYDGQFLSQVEVSGLNMDAESYKVEVYFVDSAESNQVFLWGFANYGNNAPDGPFEVDYVIAYGWWPVECSATQVDITQSYDIEKALLKRAEPGDASIVLKGLEGDPRYNVAIVIDAKLRVMLAAAASPTDDDEYLFSGFIETINTTYDIEGNIYTTINAVDALSKAMNVTIPLYEFANEESFSRRMYNIFNNYIGPVTSGVTYDPSIWEAFEQYDRQVFPPEYRENVAASEVITELTEGEYAILAQNRGGVISWFNRGVTAILVNSYEELTLEDPDYGFSTVHSNSLDHFCITDFNIRNSIEDITNRVTVSLSYDELTSVTVEDAASIAKYGERAYQVQLNLDAPDADPSSEIQRWAEEVPNTEDQFELDSVSTAVVNRQGYVTNAFMIDITIDPCRVFLDVGPVDVNGVWLAKKVRHSITPFNWTMDLDLTAD
tara:strand:+ start:9414 stop:11768 length:2355 start_codon:yes stop_codon:yes gene_type:complete